MILVAGEALVDLILSADGSVAASLGGAPYNVARACGRLGADVQFVGALSRDRFGSMLLARLVADGVDTSLASPVDVPTTLAVAELDAHGVAQYGFYVDGTSAPELAEVVVPDEATAIFAGGLGLVFEPMATSIEAMIVDRPIGVLAMVDLNCRPSVIRERGSYVRRVSRVVERADIVKASDEDLAYLIPGRRPTDAARELLDLGASVVLLTAGGDSVHVVTSSIDIVVPIAPVEVEDTIGAGDAFSAGFLTWWMAGGRSADDLGSRSGLERAVRAANAVAGLTCTRRGADPPCRSELPAGWGT